MNLSIELTDKSYLPVHRQIANALRLAILEGRLTLGAPLPSVRALSAALGVSRSTVLKSFEDLAVQGYVATTPGAGTFVLWDPSGAARVDLERQATFNEAAWGQGDLLLSTYGKRLQHLHERLSSSDLRQKIQGDPPADMLPLRPWKLLLKRHCRLKDLSSLEYREEPFGYPPLREAYAAYLTRARAASLKDEQLAVFFSRDLRLEILCRILIDEGDCVAVENPGPPSPRHTFAAHGATIIPIPVDSQGLNVEHLARLPEKIKLVYLTPSHQDPTGVALSLSRRHQVLDWARRTGAFIVEDDYDSEFRYGSRPLPSLQGLDTSDCVIHLSCCWKALSPLLRLGFLVAPICLVPAVSLAKALAERDLPLLDQFVLTDFINEGHLERHLRRLRSIYERRRQVLVQALKDYLGGVVALSGDNAGTSIIARIESDLGPDWILRCGQSAGLDVMSSAPYYIGPKTPPSLATATLKTASRKRQAGEFILSFSRLDEKTLRTAVKEWAQLLKKQAT